MNDSNDSTVLSNLAVIRGTVPNEATTRDLASGGLVVHFDVTTRIDVEGRGANVSVPVAWNDPTSTQLGIVVPGTELMVVGTVRRRFFRVAGATQSRTEVVADTVIPVRQRKRLAAALSDTTERLLAG